MTDSPHVSLITEMIHTGVSVEAHTPSSTSAASPAIGKVVCAGRNYAAHAAELGNDVPDRPVLFMKPASCVVPIRQDIIRPDPARYGETHYEAELCVQLAEPLCQATIEQAQQAVGKVTLGLDLTLRELQGELKAKGHPWERAKCFDGACVLADWVDAHAFGDLTDVQYELYINETLTQSGDTSQMLFSVYELLADISQAFRLQAGDVVMTGTPSGVGVLKADDQLTLVLGEHRWHTLVR